MSELFKRVMVAVVGIPLVIFIVYMGGYLFFGLVLIVSSLALWEYYKLCEAKNIFPNKFLGLLTGIILMLTFYIFLDKSSPLDGSIFIISEIMLFVLASLAKEMWSGRHNAIANVATTIGGVLYIPLSFCFLIALREFSTLSWFSSHATGAALYTHIFPKLDYTTCAWFVLNIFFSVWICDSAAYFVGRKFGVHKMFPRVSPKKSWEGGIAGIIGAILSFVLLSYYLVQGFPIVHSVVIGAIIGSIGQLGDFAESLLKRDASVKDSSTIIPGHGGVLDRFDSILFVVPVIFIYLALNIVL